MSPEPFPTKRDTVSTPLVNNRDTTFTVTDDVVEEDEHNKLQARGYFFICCSAVSHALMTFFIRVAESRYMYPSLSAIVVRAIVFILMSIFYLSTHGLLHKLFLSRRLFTLISLRGLFAAIAGVCTFFALKYLPVGIVMTVLYASPAMTSVLAAVFLNDPFTAAQLLTLVLNFSGVLLTSRGSYASQENGSLALIGIGFALISAMSASLVFILVRKMGFRVHFILSCLFSGLGYVLVSCVLATRDDLSAIKNNLTGSIFALLSAFAGFASQTMLTRGLQLVSPGPAAVVRSLNVPLTFLLGLVFLSERPSAFSLMGVSLVLLSVATVAWQKQLISRRQASYRPIPSLSTTQFQA